MKNPKGFVWLLALIAVVAILGISGGIYVYQKNHGVIDDSYMPGRFMKSPVTSATTQENRQLIVEGMANEWKTSNELDQGGAFTLVFKADGSVTNIGAGDAKGAVNHGTWQAYRDGDATYIKITTTDNPQNAQPYTQIYKLTKLTPTELQLVEQTRGLVLNFIPLKDAVRSSVSVPGMSKYTDLDFGFSFWYPNGWSVQAEYSGDAFVGMPATKRWVILDAHQKQIIQIKGFTFTTRSIKTSVAGCVTTLSYETQWEESQEGCGMPSRIVPYDIRLNTMGGLPALYFQPDSRIIKYIVPLTSGEPVRGLVFDTGTRLFNILPLIRTVVATGPAASASVSETEQIRAIQAEQKAYAGQ